VELLRARLVKAQLAKTSGLPAVKSRGISAAGALHDLSAAVKLYQPRTPSTIKKTWTERKRACDQRDAFGTTADPTFGTKYDLRGAGVEDSDEQIAEKLRIKDVIAFQVHDVTTRVVSKEHLLDQILNHQLPEVDESNEIMRLYHELATGGLQAFVGIHNVGGNPGYFRTDAVIDRAMLQRIITAFALMVIVPCICMTALCCRWPCFVSNNHSLGMQVFNPLLEVLVLTELPNSEASKVRACWHTRICENVNKHVVMSDPLLA